MHFLPHRCLSVSVIIIAAVLASQPDLRAGSRIWEDPDDRFVWIPLLTLVSPEEEAALEDSLGAWLEARRTETCPRPVFGGDPVDAPSAPLVQAVFEMDGEFATCHEAVQRLLDGEPRRCSDGEQCQLPDPLTTPGALLELPEAAFEAWEFCAPMERVIREAALRSDGCSPFRVGVSETNPNRLSVKPLKFLMDVGLIRDTDHDLDGYVDFLMDALWVTQDLERGWVDYIHRVRGGVARLYVHIRMHQALTTGRVSQDALEKLAAELDAYIAASHGHYQDLRGAAVSRFFWLLLDSGLFPSLPLSADGFEEPWRSKRSKEDETSTGFCLMWNSERQLKLLMFRKMWGAFPEALGQCAQASSVLDCAIRLFEEVGKDRTRIDTFNAQYSSLEDFDCPPFWFAGRKEVWEELFDLAGRMLFLGDEGLPLYRGFSKDRYLLAALRVHVETLLHHSRAGRCPSAEDLEGPRWRSVRRDGHVGAELIPEHLGDEVVWHPATPVHPTEYNTYCTICGWEIWQYSYRCPSS